MRLSFILLFLLGATNLFAQTRDSSYVKDYIYQYSDGDFYYYTDPVTSMPQMGTNSRSYFVVNDKEYKIDFFGNNLRPFVENNPSALAELDKMKSKRTVSVVGGVVTVIGLGVALANGPTKPTGETTFNPGTGGVQDKEELTSGGAVGLGIMAFGVILALTTGPSAGKHADKAIKIHNETLMASKQVSYRVLPLINSDQIGLGFRISF